MSLLKAQVEGPQSATTSVIKGRKRDWAPSYP